MNSSTPRTTLYFHPVRTLSFLVRKREGDLSSFCFQDPVRAAIKRMNKIGPKTSPCLTPMMDSMDALAPSTENFTTILCSAMMRRMNLGGAPNFLSIFQSTSLGTLSKALTKSIKRTQDSRLCSWHFLEPFLM